MTKSIVSFTFLGTTHHRDTHNTVILESFKTIESYASQEGSPVVARLFDGPGCKGSLAHPCPGTYIYANKTKKIAPAAAISKWLCGSKRLISAITGNGVEELLLEATLFLEEVIQGNGGVVPETLNLQGFSRGADNCVRFANIINRLHPSIKVNICIIDPVPGPFRRDHPDSFIIPKNVQDFRATLMLNEYRRPFKPQHPGRYIFQNTKTRVSIHHSTGAHSAGLATKNIKDLTPYTTQILMQDALLKFNLEHGSLPAGSKIHYRHQHLSNGKGYKKVMLAEPIESLSDTVRFQILCKSMDKFRSLHKRDSAQYHVYFRSILKNRMDMLLDYDLFLDKEHRELFKRAFPATFNWFFENNHMPSGQRRCTQADVFKELNALDHPRYGLFHKELLKKFQMSRPKLATDIPGPQGRSQSESFTFQRALVSDELSYLRYSLSNIMNYYYYHCADHDVLSNKQRNEIKKTLTETLKIDDALAISRLRGLISKIKQSPGNGFISQQVSKIIQDSEQYTQTVLRSLRACKPGLSEMDTQLLNRVLDKIETLEGNKSQDTYQKRLKIQTYLTSFNASLGPSHIGLTEISPEVRKLSRTLWFLTEPSYGEATVLDKIIYDLECYVYWRSFLPYYFPGWLPKTARVKFAENMIEELKALKDIGGYLLQVQQILEKASTGFVGVTSDSEKGVPWMAQLRFKSDYLNTIILKHLEKVVSITSIFSHPLQDDFGAYPPTPK